MKILLADDHDLVRDAIGLLLKRDFDNPHIDQCSNLSDLLQCLKTNDDYDLILMDLFMPGMLGASSIADVHKIANNTPIALMSGHTNRTEIKTAYEVGIKGFIPKTTTGKALSSILQLILNGQRYVPDFYLEKEEQLVVPTTGAKLTSREIEVLKGLLKGLSNKQIAVVLFIEETTVKLHLRSLYDKLEAKNRTDAVIKAMKYGLASSFI